MKEKIVILGAGESGLGTAILAKKQGFDVFVSEQGTINATAKKTFDELDVVWEEGMHSFSKMSNANWIMKSPGIPSNAPIVSQLKLIKTPVVSEIEFAARYTSATLIGVTGSNGKTTTSLLTHHILIEAGFDVGLAGNIGNSFARQVAENDHEYYVLEISSFQLDDIHEFTPHIGVITNVTPDHLDRYDHNFNNYLKSKLRITKNQKQRDFLIFNSDDPILKPVVKESLTEAKLHGFGFEASGLNKTHYTSDKITIETEKEKTMINTLEFPLSGRHNLLNAMAASTIASLLQISKATIRESLLNFKGAPHRLEPVLKIQNISYINDSKATNINSVFYALESMKSSTVWIVGGVDKGNDYEVLLPLVREKVKGIICLGIDNHKLLEVFGPVIDIIVETQSMSEAVKIAHKIAQKDDQVLLSPACASFDLFKNYEDRGDQFKEAVRNL